MASELISLGILFFCAILGGIIATKFRQPAVFGLLLVGAIIGPNAFGLVREVNTIRLMAEFGAILILFIVGLEFDLSKLMKIGARSIIIGLAKFAAVVFFGYEVSLLMGFSSQVALFVGVMLSFSSTVVIVKVLEQKELFSRKEVPLLIAILIIEDILAVLALTFFSGLGSASVGLFATFEKIIFSIAVLLLAYLITLKILKYAVYIILKNNKDESVLTFLSLGIGALFSYFAFYLRLTPSAGAFLAGSLIASLPNAKEYGKAVHPYALIFTSIFFISMGTLVDFNTIRPNLLFIGVLILTVILTRLLAIGFLTYLMANFRGEQPFFASITMMSIGEFSLLVAKESEKFALGIDLVSITAAIMFITAIMMSLGISYSESIHSGIRRALPLKSKIKIERTSNYMRSFFDQLEIENLHTRKLIRVSKAAFKFIMLSVLTFFALRRASIFIESAFSSKVYYVFIAASIFLVLYVLKKAYNELKLLQRTLAVILTYVDNSRNFERCRGILNNLLLVIALIFSAFMFPMFMFGFNLAPWTNFIPIGLLIFTGFRAYKLLGVISGTVSFAPHFKPKIMMAKF